MFGIFQIYFCLFSYINIWVVFKLPFQFSILDRIGLIFLSINALSLLLFSLYPVDSYCNNREKLLKGRFQNVLTLLTKCRVPTYFRNVQMFELFIFFQIFQKNWNSSFKLNKFFNYRNKIKILSCEREFYSFINDFVWH